ncbi:hypothetical protein [Caballeronia grimmiae]|uniref:hypothetical protein n=1 Tax=Caballeronia grimmiae TaxID=1071679 RepID=UPI0038BDA91A
MTIQETASQEAPFAIHPAGARSNPCLDYVQKWTDYADMLDRLTIVPERLRDGMLQSDATANFATEEQARLVQVVLSAIYYSTLERNPADFAFQNLLLAASNVLADTEDAHGRRIPTLPVSVPNAGARGFFVSIPAEMGQHTLVRAIEDIVGKGVAAFQVTTPSGMPIRVNRLKSLTVPFPSNASPKRFVNTLLHELDDAIGTGYANDATGPFHRNSSDCAIALSAMGIQQNLGLLIVPFITAGAMAQSASGVLLGELSQFATLTGIPVLCLGSPGAAAALHEHGSSAAALYSMGGTSIPAFRVDEPQWRLWAEYLWDTYFEPVFTHGIPDWFTENLWSHTLGHTDAATKLSRYVFSLRTTIPAGPLSQELLSELAEKALVLLRAPLNALRLTRQTSRASRAGVRRFADWLPLDVSILAIPSVTESYGDTLSLPLVGEAT